MATPVLFTPADAIPADALARAAEVLRNGGLVAFPTETVYGLGANALDGNAVARIFAAKGRPAHNPLIVHVGDAREVRRVVADWPSEADDLARRFWPGPLTLVLPRREEVPDVVTGGGPTVAVRCPSHPVARALLEATGLPLAAPSANRSNQLSPTRAEHVLRDLDGRIDLILDGGPTPGGIESTVLDLTTRPARLLRPGLLSVGELEGAIGPIARSNPPGEEGEALRSPGMLPRHYAPRTPLECRAGDARQRVEALQAEGQRVGWVTHRAEEVGGGLPGVVVVLPDDPVGYAARLYEVLHDLDRAELDRIVVSQPPEGEEWLGIRDRLWRASR
jgi:L-threonylcarbamoyladenylate synthase